MIAAKMLSLEASSSQIELKLPDVNTVGIAAAVIDIYFFLKAAMALFVCSLKASLPLTAALSYNRLSQCSVPLQKTFFSAAIAAEFALFNVKASLFTASSSEVVSL